MEKGGIEHEDSKSCGYSDGGPQAADRSVISAGSSVLGHEGGHRLHEGSRNQHDKAAYLFRDAYAG